MRKIYLYIIIGVIIASTLITLLIVFNNHRNNSIPNNKNKSEHVRKIEEQYLQLLEMAELRDEYGNVKKEEDIAKEFSQLFKEIAQGSAENSQEYAELIAEITGKQIIDNDQVFRIAEEYSQVYTMISDGFDDFGIQQIKIVKNHSGEKILVMDYIDINSYSVKNIDKNDQIFLGEKLVNGEELGEYLIQITFYGLDMGTCRALNEQYGGKVHVFDNVPDDLKSKFKIRTTRPPDDSIFVIYIGSDMPINIEEKEVSKVDHVIGSIEVLLKDQV